MCSAPHHPLPKLLVLRIAHCDLEDFVRGHRFYTHGKLPRLRVVRGEGWEFHAAFTQHHGGTCGWRWQSQCAPGERTALEIDEVVTVFHAHLQSTIGKFEIVEFHRRPDL